MSIINRFFKTGLIVKYENISKKNILKLTEKFGKLHPKIKSSELYHIYHQRKNTLSGKKKNDINIVGHSDAFPIGKNLDWHQDGVYYDKKGEYFGIFLYPFKNSSIVDTLFSDVQSLYNDLSSSDKRDLENVKLTYYDPAHLFKKTKKVQKRTRSLIMSHPITGKKCLILSPLSLVCSFKDSPIYKFIMSKVPNYTIRIKWKDRSMFCLTDCLKYMHKTEPSKFYKNGVSRMMWRVQFNYDKIQLF